MPHQSLTECSLRLAPWNYAAGGLRPPAGNGDLACQRVYVLQTPPQYQVPPFCETAPIPNPNRAIAR